MSRITMMRLEQRMISSSSELIKMIPMPFLHISSIRRWISALAPTSMPRVGSSRISTSGPDNNHLLSTTFC